MRRLLAISGLTCLCLTMTLGLALAQPTSMSVCDAIADGDGDCVADIAATNDEICVEGIILAWKHFGARGAGAIYDPVSGCCMSIFDIDLIGDLAIGTKVEVCGWMADFAGLAEIVDNPADGTMDPTVNVIGSGAVPAATAVSGLELQDGSALAESLESCLVSTCGTFEATGDFNTFSTNYNFITTDGNTVIVRIDSDTDVAGTPIPAGNVNVTGILGQFDGFGAALCGGYQLLPRFTADLAATLDCGPVSTEDKSWGGVKSQFED